MSTRKRKLNELIFDLVSVRQVKRKLRRALRDLEAIERSIVRMNRNVAHALVEEPEGTAAFFAAVADGRVCERCGDPAPCRNPGCLTPPEDAPSRG